MTLELYQKGEPAPPPAVITDDETRPAGGAGRALACAACGHVVTSTAARVAVDGKHEHACFNPHGYLFRFGCFSAAPGVAARGEPTLEWTWFPGFAWQYCHCARCGVHLGWRFQSGERGFYGLILKRLVEVDEEGP